MPKCLRLPYTPYIAFKLPSFTFHLHNCHMCSPYILPISQHSIHSTSQPYIFQPTHNHSFSTPNCQTTRRYGALRAPTSSSCRGLVAFGRLEGPSGPPDPTPLITSCIGYFFSIFFYPIFFIGGQPPIPPRWSPSYPLHRVKKKKKKKKKIIGGPPIPPSAGAPPTPCTEYFLFLFFLPNFFTFFLTFFKTFFYFFFKTF